MNISVLQFINSIQPLTLLLYFQLFNIITIFIMLISERNNYTNNVFWMVFFLTNPIIGFLIYLFIGRAPVFGRKKKYLSRYEKSTNYGKKLQSQVNSTYAANELNEKAKEILDYNFKENGTVCSKYNELKIYTENNEAFDSMLRDIQDAKIFVNLLFYSIKPDESGKRLREALVKKAAEGVEINVLYDDLGSFSMYDDFFEKLEDAGGRVVRFFPSFIKIININTNYRNHRKIVVIDNKIGYIGSANIGDKYLGLEKIENWRDTNLRIKGEAVFLMNLRLISDFNFASNVFIEPQSFPKDELEEKPILPIQIVSDGPDTDEPMIQNSYVKAIYAAKKRVYIQTPYFMPDEVFMEALKSAVRSGVDVRIMLPKVPDIQFVYNCTMSFAAELALARCKIYLWNGFIHSKTLLIDDDISSVGSFNIDIRSFRLNFEVTAFIYDKKVCEQLKNIFEEDMCHSKKYTAEDAKNRSVFLKTKQRFSRLMSPLF